MTDIVPATASAPVKSVHEEGKCPHCGAIDQCILTKEASLFTIFSIFVTFIFFGMFSVILIPIVMEVTKTTVKRCLACSGVIEQKELFSLPSLSDQVLQFRCGSCALVISRKYAIVALVIIVIMYFTLRSKTPPASHAHSKDIDLVDLRWETFVTECGRKVFIDNGVRARNHFLDKFSNRIVEWKGVLQEIATHLATGPSYGHEHGRSALANVAEEGSLYLFVKMVPTDSHDFPDLMILASPSMLGHEVIDILKRDSQQGDVLSFKAVFVQLGGEFRFHELKALSVQRTGERVAVNNIPMIEDSNAQKSNLRGGERQNQLAP
eukprot:TRINITY_DN6127_c0_g2_i3.p1 TRINITY_DN6127_c0_g2~~TRINITY_DN6127_c0_g2_i3.p1  ORF type:complete len:322 (+),score=36.76 TRINITY_DN6127_c0_g2_i3:132-1097(+)